MTRHLGRWLRAPTAAATLRRSASALPLATRKPDTDTDTDGRCTGGGGWQRDRLGVEREPQADVVAGRRDHGAGVEDLVEAKG